MDYVITPPIHGYAAIQLLDYEANRSEFTVNYLSDSFEELAVLLQDPVQYLKHRAKGWKAGYINPKEWELNKPATVILSYAGNTVSGRLRMYNLALRILRERGEKVEHRLGIEIVTEQLFRETVDRAFVHGGFVAQFALRTHVLYIQYFIDPNTFGRASMRSHRGTFTNSTMVTANTEDYPPNPYLTAAIHVDIGKNPMDRAHFAMDFIDDAAHLLTQATTAPGRVFMQGSAQFVEEGEVLSATMLEESDPPILKNYPKLYPTVVMEGVSPAKRADDCLICCESTVFTPDGRIWFPEVGFVKCYMPPG